jgi:PAS domain S-box-containing protein
LGKNVLGIDDQAVLLLLGGIGLLALVAIQSYRLYRLRAVAGAWRSAMLDMDMVYEQAPLGLAVLDRDLRFIRVNKLLAEFNGASNEEHVGKTISEIVPDLAPEAIRPFADVVRTGVPLHGLLIEGTTRARPSEWRSWRESVHPLRDARGAIIGISVAVEEITEQKRLTDALNASESRDRRRAAELETVMDATPAAVFIAHDRACRNVTANAEATRVLHLRPGENPSLSAPGTRPFEVVADGVPLSPDQLPLQKAAATGEEVWGMEVTIRFPDGRSPLHVLMNAVPLRDELGEVFGAVAAFVDMTAQKMAAESLKLEAHHKDEFLAVLAHELRNPLATIQSGLELMKTGAGASSGFATTRATMERQMRHVIRLIDDLLDVARIGSGKLELRTEPVAVHEIVEAAIELSRRELEAARHVFRCQLPPDALYVEADKVRLTEVIGNLLHNAAKYTPPGGEIALTVGKENGRVKVQVTDNGVGIAPEVLSGIFAMFSQAERSRLQRKGGLGVGLALARRLVDLHGGVLSAHSGGLGQGSTFTVCLPLCDGPRERAACGGAGKAGAAAFRQRRILILDDNADAAHTLGALLEASGHAVRLAYTGYQALEAANEFAPQIAFLDIGLPDISGHDVALQLRERYPGRELVLVALTGWGSDGDRRLSEQAGFDFHLTKPVSVEAINSLFPSLIGLERGARISD